MDHVAIMKKSWGLLPKVLSGQKKIESRWYRVKAAPWGRIKGGDNIYFKDSGEPVTVRSEVSKVLSFDGLTPKKVSQILNEYGQDDGIEEGDVPVFYKRFRDKKYCLLIFLKAAQKIKPFHVNKKGFGAMAAWLVVRSIGKIRVKP